MKCNNELILCLFRKPLLVIVACVSFCLAVPIVIAEGSFSRSEALGGSLLAQFDPFWNDPQEGLDIENRNSCEPALCEPVADMMEEGPLPRNWSMKFMKPRSRFSIQDDYYHEGSRSLAVSLIDGDPPYKKGIHKHELRIACDKRCYFGEEVWYSFLFRIEGDYPRKGSTRWVIGQWKEDTGGNPFLAQRFDNGVFHITIQRNKKRVLIAAAAGDPCEEFEFFSEAFRKTLQAGEQDICEPGILSKLNDPGSAALDVDSLNKAIVEQDIPKFPFVADPESYGKIDGLKIMPSETPLLPSPASNWVDMRYRIKGDRDGKGFIEVWANGVPIVKVTGKIGNDKFDGPTQYFKIGHYRDIDKDFKNAVIYFDRFKRGTKEADVD